MLPILLVHYFLVVTKPIKFSKVLILEVFDDTQKKVALLAPFLFYKGLADNNSTHYPSRALQSIMLPTVSRDVYTYLPYPVPGTRAKVKM